MREPVRKGGNARPTAAHRDRTKYQRRERVEDLHLYDPSGHCLVCFATRDECHEDYCENE